MKVKVTIQDLGTFGYTSIFIVLAILFFFFIRVMYRTPEEKEKEKPKGVGKEEMGEKDEEDVKGENFFNPQPKSVRMLILFGTQTGTAEEFAESLCLESKKKFGLLSHCACISDYGKYWPDVLSGAIPIVAFVVSTYGEGEPTDNAKAFFQYLKKNAKDDDLSKVKFVLFGLGNSLYKEYQAMGRKTAKLMIKNGATLISHLGEEKAIGEGNADQYIEDDFDEWKLSILERLSDKFHTEKNLEEDFDDWQPKYEIIWISTPEDKIPDPFYRPRVRPTPKAPFGAVLESKKELLKDSPDASTLELVFDISKSRIRFHVGDHLAIMPENDLSLIMEYAKRLNFEDKMSSCFSLIDKTNPIKGNRYYRKTCLKNCLIHYLDLTTPPKRNHLKSLIRYTSDPKEKERLIFLVSDEGKQDFREYIIDSYRRLIDVLEDFKSCHPPLEVFLEITPIKVPRYYSIACSSKVSPKKIRLVLSVYRYTSPINGRKGTGVCSHMLENLKIGDKALCWIRETEFRLPEESKLKESGVIMISNGTGIAPFVGFVEELRNIAQTNDLSAQQNMFFFGCRNKEKDWIYEEKIKNAEKDGILGRVSVAFSRDQEKKIYVQDVMKEHLKEICEVIEKGGSLYICGSTEMAKSVDDLILRGMVEYIPKITNEKEALNFLKGRYFTEAWNV